VIVGFVFIYSRINKYETECRQYAENIQGYHYQGIVVNKWNDEEDYDYLKISYKSSDNGDSTTIYYPRDSSGFLEYTEIGDSISKIANSMRVYVFRNSVKREFDLDFNCR
jgi:hypothetical protein